MASLYRRLNKDGSITHRVVIRRKNLPVLCLSFVSLKEAKAWIKEHEKRYIENPDEYQTWIEKERLNLARKREFKRSAA